MRRGPEKAVSAGLGIEASRQVPPRPRLLLRVKRANAGLSDIDILVFGAVADPDSSHADAVDEQREAAAQGDLVPVTADGESQREQDVNFVSGARWPAGQAADGGAVR